jgi:N-acetylglucosaminyldiphosphoundecaprenol N-acetyl-beta-D-mannosaminyltransferase
MTRRYRFTTSDLQDLSLRLLTSDAALDDRILAGRRVRIQTVNLQHLYLASKDARFREVLFAADYITADGWPVAALFRAFGIPTSRVTGSDLLPRILNDPKVKGRSFGLLGSSDDAGSFLTDLMVSASCRLAFRNHGLAAEWDPLTIAAELNAVQPAVLLVAVTSPQGEFVSQSIRDAGFEGSVICIGAAMDMLVGNVARAPVAFRKLGLEWAFRLVAEPRRLWRRYLVECLGQLFAVVIPLGFAASCRRALRSL